MTRGRIWIAVLTLVVIGGALGGYWMLRAGASSNEDAATAETVPTARVVKGSMALDVFVNGELRAARSVMLPAPSVGGTLRILRMVPTGTAVKAGDVIVELEPSDQEYAVEQAQSQLNEADLTIVKRKADLTVQAAEQEVALLTARFDVRRAELDARVDQDLISAADYARRQLALEQAKQQLARAESDAKTRRETDRVALTLVEEGRAKAQLAMTRAKMNIESLTIKAPMDGQVVVRQNYDAMGGMYFGGGVSMPEYRAGDNTSAGRPLVDVYDLGGMQLRVKVNELARANVAVGQAAEVISDGLPGRVFKASVSTVAGNVQASYWGDSGPARQFDASLTLEKTDAALRPGTTVRATLKGKTVDDVLQVPLQAVRQKNGETIVFVQTPAGFETRTVKVVYRTESRAALEGISEGAVVALVDPTTAPTASPTPTSGSRK